MRQNVDRAGRGRWRREIDKCTAARLIDLSRKRAARSRDAAAQVAYGVSERLSVRSQLAQGIVEVPHWAPLGNVNPVDRHIERGRSAVITEGHCSSPSNRDRQADVTALEIFAALALKGVILHYFFPDPSLAAAKKKRLRADTKSRAEHSGDARIVIDLRPQGPERVWSIEQRPRD